MPPETIVQKRLHQAFEVGIVLKGINALTELILGTLLLFVNVTGIIQTLIDNALVEDPDNFFATHMKSLTHISPESQFYGALYLLSHGVVKAVLVVGLLRNKMWAYPASLAVLSLFIVYQVIRFFQTYSIGLVLLTIFDLVIIWLVWEEYRRVSGKGPLKL